jgi:hypothetical protein
MIGDRLKIGKVALATSMLALFAASLLSAAMPARVSALPPPACSEYLSLPGCAGNPGGGGGTPGTPGGGGGGIPGAPGTGGGGGGGVTATTGGSNHGSPSDALAPGNAPGGASAARGELPFTDYPLTPLILLLVVLLTAGLLFRAYVAVRNRIRTRDAAGGAPPFGSI